ncbi:hypothetical protein [Nitrospirillum iridis]|uniref:Uncharacterized protein n=1 Tax=Nitrospirillum iridis TaxID=765888 RepID=A0A7X0B2R5_9PROT|nr:hypothetical protein [Nitrospirillum iridis]MBB6253149.1 hypothetical protein [Nitrospirillum iridis]
MPLALLLQETVYTLRWGAFHLEPWNHLVRVEELLIDRARGAFLIHWFGRALPLRGSRVSVVIDNLDALRTQYFRARSSLAPDIGGPNLAEPLSGLAGEVLGIALSPTAALLAVAVMVRDLPYWLRTLSGALGWKAWLLILEPLAGPVIGPILLPLAVFERLVLAITNPGQLRDVYALLSAAALFLIAATAFLKVLLGPRDKIANPLLRDILGLFDQLAGLVPFVLAFFAFIIVRVGPLIEPLAEQMAAFQGLIGAVVDTVGDIFDDIGGAVYRILPFAADRLDFVVVQLGLVFPVFDLVFTSLFTDLGDQLGEAVDKGSKAIIGWSVAAKEMGIAIIQAQPLAVRIESAKISFAIAADALSPGPSSSGGGSSLPKDFPVLKLTKPEDFLRARGGPPRGGLGVIEKWAEIDIKYGGALFQDYLPFSDAAKAGVAAAQKPTQVFDAEQGVLARRLGQEPRKALAALRVDQLRLRDLLSAVVGRVLPGDLRVEMGTLLDVFRKLDISLYQLKAEKKDFPVLDLPDNGQLRPIVHRLVIRGVDLARADADTFQVRLQEAMNALAYPAQRPAQGLAVAGG